MITEPFVFIVLGLASYRLARVITRDEIFNFVRNRIWDRFPPEKNKFGYLFTCMWCMSIWTSLGLTISSIIIPKITLYVCIVLALSAIAGLLAAYEDKD